jgi:hypothetical protein
MTKFANNLFWGLEKVSTGTTAALNVSQTVLGAAYTCASTGTYNDGCASAVKLEGFAKTATEYVLINTGVKPCCALHEFHGIPYHLVYAQGVIGQRLTYAL